MKKIGNKAGLLSFLDELVAQDSAGLQPLQDGEFTLKQYKEKINKNGLNISEASADRRLKKLIQEGVLQSRVGNVEGRKVIIYREKA